MSVTVDNSGGFIELVGYEFSHGSGYSFSLDRTTGASASGYSSNPYSGSVDASAPVLLVSAVTTTGGVTAWGSGFNNRVITSPDGDLLQDEIVAGKSGPLSDGATLGGDAYWVSQLVSFN